MNIQESLQKNMEHEKGRLYWISTEELLHTTLTDGQFNVAGSIEELRPSFFYLLKSPSVQDVLKRIESDDCTIPLKTEINHQL